MKVQRLIKKYKKLEGVWNAEGAELARQIFLMDLEQLDEPRKVKVPQFVADWIENVKENGLLKENFSGNRIGISVGDDVQRVLYFIFQKRIVEGEVLDWILDNTNTFARAWLDGYEVEKEKRYLVSMPNTSNHKGHTQILCEKDNKFFWCGEWHPFRTKFTYRDLEEAGFEWVCSCPGIEVKEVE